MIIRLTYWRRSGREGVRHLLSCALGSSLARTERGIRPRREVVGDLEIIRAPFAKVDLTGGGAVIHFDGNHQTPPQGTEVLERLSPRSRV